LNYRLSGRSWRPNSAQRLFQLPCLSCGGQVSPARLVVNQADDDALHDRTPLFDRGYSYQASVSGFSPGNENGSVTLESLLPARPDETCSWDRDRAARTRRDDTVRRIRRSRMSCARRIPFACAFRSPPDSRMWMMGGDMSPRSLRQSGPTRAARRGGRSLAEFQDFASQHIS
jgi:hypothetical protein